MGQRDERGVRPAGVIVGFARPYGQPGDHERLRLFDFGKFPVTGLGQKVQRPAALILGEWFTREDVEELREWGVGAGEIAPELAASLADRIEALLPPARPTPGEPA